MNKRSLVLTGIIAATAALFVMAQDAGEQRVLPRHFGTKDENVPRDPRDFGRLRGEEYPDWKVSKDLPNDVFTFARIRYNSAYRGRSFGRRGGGGKWMTDYPDSDLNLSFRLQQLTSLQVNPVGVVVDIEPDQVKHYPFLYMLEVGDIDLTDAEAATLRNYMLNGGFIMVDDFWGDREWNNFYVAFKQIWPDREFEELPIEHEIFNIVFPLKVKPQVPHIRFKEDVIYRGITYEDHGPGSEHVHYRGVYDDKHRLVMIICHNTDTGEGWEQEGSDPWYFTEFSEKFSYPLGINIVFYALTH